VVSDTGVRQKVTSCGQSTIQEKIIHVTIHAACMERKTYQTFTETTTPSIPKFKSG
jgi:hypothetical protein